MKNQCKHGLKGINCAFLHPARCTKLLQNGTRSPDGCNLGKKCSFFHPKMCPSSISKRVCFDDKCQFVHVKGTKRIDRGNSKPPKTPFPVVTSKPASINPLPAAKLAPTHSQVSPVLLKKDCNLQVPTASPTPLFPRNQKLQESSLPTSPQCSVAGGSSDASFLDIINLLKKELSDVVETKMALSQMQHHFPRMHHSPPFIPNMMHQSTMPTYPFHPQLPQFPPMANH